MSATTNSSTGRLTVASANLPPEEWAFTLIVRKGQDGPEVGRELVSPADLLDPQCELWLDGWLRKGHTQVRLDDLDFRLRPQFGQTAKRCDGFVLRAQSGRDRAETVFERQYSVAAFADVAARCRHRLIEAKVLNFNDPFWYEVEAAPTVVGDRPGRGELFPVTADDVELKFQQAPIRPLLEKADAIGEVDGVFPVFYVADALSQSEQFARRGADRTPPIESGGMLVGVLGSCQDTGEFYVVVTTVFEVQDADEGQFSLTYSGKSWNRIQSIVRAMQTQPATEAHRILGQCHGHNFPPAGGAPPCDLCYTQQVCHRSSVFVSVDDRIWSQAVFSRQPWQLCHIYGSNARQENVSSLFTLKENRLQERGFYVIPSFP